MIKEKNDIRIFSYILKDFSKIIKTNALSFRHELGNDTDCFRLYDCNLDQLKIVVEKYGNNIRILDFSDYLLDENIIEDVKDICYRMLYVNKENVFYIRRIKDTLNYKNLKSFRTFCIESGLKFEVEMLHYIDSGLFLENVYARRFIRDNAYNKRVLNLFSYTGSFSIYAITGGANTVISVDLSETYTKWAERNIKNNGFNSNIHKCICSDAKIFIEFLIKSKEFFDIIIFDPPVFSNSKKMSYDFRADRDSLLWIKMLNKILNKNGFILFCNNSKLVIKEKVYDNLTIINKTYSFKAPGFIKKNNKGKTEHYIFLKNRYY